MKHCFLMLLIAAMALGCARQSGNRVESLLSRNKAVWKDEMFTFHVSYSDVKMNEQGLQFTQTLLHKEASAPGQYKIVGKVKIPLDLVQSSERIVKVNDGIGRNTQLYLILPGSIAMTGKIETVMENGEIKKEDASQNSSEIRIPFSDAESATIWNQELTNYIQKMKSAKK